MRRIVTVAVTALVLLAAAPAHAVVPTVTTATTATLVETSLNAKDTAHITGAVTFTGETVAAPLTLSVVRGYNGVNVPLPSLTTAADGTFAFSDLVHVGPTTYTFVYPGDAAHRASSVKVTAVATALPITLTAAAGAATYTRPLTVTGTVTYPGDGPVPVGSQVNVATTGACPNIEQASTTTTAGGAFTAQIVPACPTSVNVIVSHGAVDHAFAVLPPIVEPVAKTVPGFDLSTSQPIGYPPLTVNWLDPTQVVAGVTTAVGPGRMDVYETPHRLTRRLIQSVAVPVPLTTPTVTISPARDTTITVVYSGDAGNLAGSKTFELKVRPLVRQQFQLYAAISGGYFKYARGHRPDYGMFISPQTSGTAVIQGQRLIAGAWVTQPGTTIHYASGTFSSLFSASGRAGQKWRYRTISPANSLWDVGVTPWSYVWYA